MVSMVMIAALAISRKRYYSALFHESTFQRFYESMSKAVMASIQMRSAPSIDSGTAFVLPEGIAASVTFDKEDGHFQLHISLSQSDRRTTHAVASRFGYFVLAMLNKNRAKLSPFFTASGVHHLIFALDTADIVLNRFDESYSDYNHHYRPIPFESDNSPMK